MHYKASYYCRQLGLSPVREILAASIELKPRLFHPRAEGVVLFVWLRAALGAGPRASIPCHVPLAAQVAKQVGSGGRKEILQAETHRC